ncbi:MAG: branched-chain amino acid ABC transporter permease, partial [Solirubrobacteraceae bacterium]
MRRRLALAALVAGALALPFGLSAAQLTIATFVVIAGIGATGLNVLTGYAGQISLGHAAFLGVGAYTGAVLGADHGISAFVWIPAAGLAAALLGALLGPIALRLRGLYLAIVTLGLVFIAQHVFFNADGLTGGPQGRAFPAVELGA